MCIINAARKRGHLNSNIGWRLCSFTLSKSFCQITCFYCAVFFLLAVSACLVCYFVIFTVQTCILLARLAFVFLGSVLYIKSTTLWPSSLPFTRPEMGEWKQWMPEDIHMESWNCKTCYFFMPPVRILYYSWMEKKCFSFRKRTECLRVNLPNVIS